ncbi:MAG: bifunctional 4-hydroxy-2-oxoglutarate aldolase/2-dehydro-3-deoxy-phosphogluconate aldolase [Firmicutes bacterium]|nr:bifunctional 4-hydroxy-2-oxoglutarate aldolase/2-dehydro-3-deoxy-phosphogluconate aldolase [Bacillota bacterium]
MDRETILSMVRDTKVVAIVRRVPADYAYDIAAALVEGGIQALEFTAETPGITRIIEDVRRRLPDSIAVGVGTVLDGETARVMLLSGADFIVTPTVNQTAIEVCGRYGKLVMPGAMTPTEILTAYEYGADLVKVFPAGVLGVSYFRSLQGPLPHIPLMATGGISADNAQEFLQAGVTALGVGGSLVPAQAVRAKDYQVIEKEARRLMQAVFEHE